MKLLVGFLCRRIKILIFSSHAVIFARSLLFVFLCGQVSSSSVHYHKFTLGMIFRNLLNYVKICFLFSSAMHISVFIHSPKKVASILFVLLIAFASDLGHCEKRTKGIQLPISFCFSTKWPYLSRNTKLSETN